MDAPPIFDLRLCSRPCSCPRVRVFLYLLLLCLCTAAHASDFRLGPFLSHQSNTSQTFTAIHPLLSWGELRTTTSTLHFVDVLYPLGRAYTRRTTSAGGLRPRTTRTRWLMPLYYDKQTSEAGQSTRRTVVFPLWYSGAREPGGSYRILFPFYWQAEPGARFYFPAFEPEIGRSWALWPLAGQFRGAFNSDRLRFFLWPLWVHSQSDARPAGPAGINRPARAAERSTTLLWPILGWTSGDDVTGWKLWPLVSWRARRDGSAHQLKFLWPLGHHVTRPAADNPARGVPPIHSSALLPFYLHGTYGRTELLYATPLYARARHLAPGDGRVVELYRAWLWPLLSRRAYLDRGTREWRLLHILGIWNNDPARRRWQLFPLAGSRTIHDGAASEVRRFVLAPFFFDRATRHADGRRFDRRYLFPLLIAERWSDASGALTRRRFALWPLWRSTWAAGEGSGPSSDFSAPHLLWFTSDGGLLRNWAPLWTLYRRQQAPGHTPRHEALWGLLRWGGAPRSIPAIDSVVNPSALADNARL